MLNWHSLLAQLLPHRTCGQLVDYYYGVWKERAHPRARAWYQRLAEVCAPLPLFPKKNNVQPGRSEDSFSRRAMHRAMLIANVNMQMTSVVVNTATQQQVQKGDVYWCY